jgi:CDP-diacylglycerol--glycerol-3-phosphate 3-phosphatidyltransferase
MLTEWLRRVFRGVLESIAGFFFRLGIGANTLTIIGALLNVGVGIVAAMGHLRWAGLFLGFASVFDALDGTVARRVGRVTKFGAFLDSVLDRVSEAAVLLGIAVWHMSQPGLTAEILAYMALIGSFLVSYTRARAEGLGVTCKAGIFTRVERCVLLIVALLLNLVYPALWILAVGSILTALHRVIHVYVQLRGERL